MVHMPESRPPRWPRFELVTFPEPTGFPRELATPLLERGAPKDLLGSRFQAANTLTPLEAPPFGLFVRFATDGISDSLCLEQICKRLDRRAASSGVPARVDSLDTCLIFLRFAVGSHGSATRPGRRAENVHALGPSR